MESDGGNFSYGGPPRMDRVEQIGIPQHLTLAQPRVQAVTPEGANPLDLTSAIVHELQRCNNQQDWHSWNHQLGGIQSSAEQAIGLQLPSYGSYFFPQNDAGFGRLLPQNIPRFEDSSAPSIPHMPTRNLDYATEMGSLVGAHQGFYFRSTDGLPLHLGHQVLENSAPSLGISTRLSLAQRGVGDVNCVPSQTVDFQSCHSTGVLQHSDKSMRSALFNPQHESTTVEISADLCTDEEDLETRPLDEKRKKRMLSNRASAQRSRQRRQERLDQLEVLTAQLRVENSTLQKKLTVAIQAAKKFEDENKNLQKKVERLTKELEGGGKPKKPIPAGAGFDECASSQQTTCASSYEMVGGQLALDPHLMRNMNDGASTQSTPAGSPRWPSGSCPTETEREQLDVAHNGNRGEMSPVPRSPSACRVGKKRSFDESEAAAGTVSVEGSQPNRPRPSPAPTGHVGGEPGSNFLEPRVFGSSFGLDPALKDDSTVDCLETTQWLEFADCFK